MTHTTTDDEHIERIEMDKHSAFATWFAFEYTITRAIKDGRFRTAADMGDALFLHAAQLSDWFDEYQDIDELIEAGAEPDAVETELAIQMSIQAAREWAIEHDHPFAEWFEDDDSTDDAASIDIDGMGGD